MYSRGQRSQNGNGIIVIVIIINHQQQHQQQFLGWLDSVVVGVL